MVLFPYLARINAMHDATTPASIQLGEYGARRRLNNVKCLCIMSVRLFHAYATVGI